MGSRRRPESNSSDPVCSHCSKPISPGNAAAVAGAPVHVRCLARERLLESLENRARAGETRLQALALRERAEALIDGLRDRQSGCPVCRAPLGRRRGLVVRDGRLVHRECGRGEAGPSESTRR
jgi:hypothetical protein